MVEETATILRHFGFEFDQRGLVSVKGKGKLMTYYLTGRSRKDVPQLASPAAGSSGGIGGGGGGKNSPTAAINSARPSPAGSTNGGAGTQITKSATAPPVGSSIVQTPGATISPAAAANQSNAANCVTAAPDSISRKSFIQDLRGANKQSASISIV